jgi:ferredoxin
MYSKKIVIRYPAEVIEKPIVYHLVKDFDLRFNILKARVSPRREGLLVLELSGEKDNFDKGIRYMKECGLKVEPLSKSVIKNEDRCVHCGACLAFCPTSASHMDQETMKVIFDPEKCTGCELCMTACPLRAMEIDLL